MASGNSQKNTNNNNRNIDHPPGNQLSDTSMGSEDVDKVVDEIVNNLNFSQELLGSGTPVSPLPQE